MSCMKPQRALAAEMLGIADNLKALAKLVGDHNPPLANALLRNALLVAFAQRRVERMERELASAQRTVREIALDAAEDAAGAEARACPTAATIAAMAVRERHARIIAGILAPTLRHPGQP